MTTTPCPHCRQARPLEHYLEANFVDKLRGELAAKEKAVRRERTLKEKVVLDVINLRSRLAAYDKQFEQVTKMYTEITKLLHIITCHDLTTVNIFTALQQFLQF